MGGPVASLEKPRRMNALGTPVASAIASSCSGRAGCGLTTRVIRSKVGLPMPVTSARWDQGISPQ
jgi:hypothetical protein